MTSSAQNPVASEVNTAAASGPVEWTRGDRLRNRNATSLTVLVPAYNEQYLIEASLRRLSVLGESSRLEHIQVIVVDDCSEDATAQSIERFQQFLETSADFKKFSWLWLRHLKNSGKGAAIRTALAHSSADLIVTH
ncbi:MAG: glycosyltransferase, partial [Candidatus Acidiferrales bacterium]